MNRTPAWYKFHNSRFTQSWLSGQIRISSLDYFAYREWPGGDDQIGDRLEAGAQMVAAEPLVWQADTAPPNTAWLRQQNIVVHDGGGINLRIEAPTIILADDPAHILCLAEGDFSTCSEYWLAEGYDAAVEILDVPAFAYALWREGFTKRGTPLRDLFGEPKFDWVTYGDKRVDLSESRLPIRGPFMKPDRLAAQAEYRICWPQLDPRVRDQLDVVLPRPERFISRRLDGPVADRPEPQTAQPTLAEATNLLLARHEAWERDRPAKRPPFSPREASDSPDLVMAWFEELSRQAREGNQLFEQDAKRLIWRWRLESGRRFNLAGPYDEGGATMLYLKMLAGTYPSAEMVDILE
ncbi:hypothetical protein [Phenylobacterium sp.]|uniref:hypothetical protein n=1 Tax=Phenylobacterium sp. TaxID=1871053 RepID=UPI00272F673E|nr:hypothetical protein [Phenylobacterium sp.]MDP1618870.1 hypothetical protein [Phenylobacterium sp.]